MTDNTEIELISKLLENWIDSTAIWTDGQVYKVKKLVETISDLKIIVYPQDHYPSHFHVKSTQRNIDAQFYLDSLELIKDRQNNIKVDDIKKIQAFFELFKEKRVYLVNEYNRLNH